MSNIEEIVLQAGNLRKKGELDEAEQILRSVSESHSEHWPLWAELGHIFVAKTEYDAARAALLKAIDLEPEWSRLWTNLGFVQKELGNLDGAIESTLKARDLSNTETDKNVANYNLACYYCLAGNKNEALSCLTEALTSDSSMKEWAQEDSDFDSIRDNKEFVELVET